MADDDQPPTNGNGTEAEYRDELPADLDLTSYVGVYEFPNNDRRRIPGLLYLGSALILVLIWALGGDSVLVNDGYAWVAVLLAAVGVVHLVTGVRTTIDEKDALVIASKDVGFPVGHAAAQRGWRGIRSRPTWRVLLYSADEPPTMRGLVLIDAVDGTPLDKIVEDNPEDWSASA